MMKIIGFLLIVWLVVAILGAVIKGLVWLTVLGAVLFVATAAYGYRKRRSGPTALR
jgi:LPXTG-motif cell wall-anchored protein